LDFGRSPLGSDAPFTDRNHHYKLPEESGWPLEPYLKIHSLATHVLWR
jgi:hypothetical protein